MVLLSSNSIDVLIDLTEVDRDTLQDDLVWLDEIVFQVGIAQVERMSGTSHACAVGIPISYPSLRVDTLQVKVESVGSVPPGPASPLGMKTLDLQIESDLCPDGAAKGESLTEFASQLTVNPF